MICVLAGEAVYPENADKSSQTEWMDKVRNMLLRVNAEYGQALLIPLRLLHGGSFSAVLSASRVAFDMALEIAKGMFGAQLRIALCAGELTLPPDLGGSAPADGPAMRKALGALQSMAQKKSGDWLRISAVLNGQKEQPVLQSCLDLWTHLISGWTDKQRAAIWSVEACAMQRKYAAQDQGVSAAAVSRHLSAAGFALYRSVAANIAEYLETLDSQADSQNEYLQTMRAARASYEKADYKAALEGYSHALIQTEQALGLDHRLRSRVYLELAETHRQMQSYDIAIDNLNKALELLDKYPADAEKISAMNMLGAVFMRKGQHQQAEQYLKNTVKLSESVLGKAHPETAFSYENLARVHAFGGAFDESLSLLIKALDIVQRVYGPYHPETANVYGNIANRYANKRAYPKAVEVYEQTIAIFTRALGGKHPLSVKARKNLQQVAGRV